MYVTHFSDLFYVNWLTVPVLPSQTNAIVSPPFLYFQQFVLTLLTSHEDELQWMQGYDSEKKNRIIYHISLQMRCI